MYSTPGDIIHGIYFMCGIYMCIHHTFMSNIWHICTGEVLFIYGIYVAIICEVNVAVGWILAHICKNVGCNGHAIQGLCDLFLQCCRHMLYVSNVKCNLLSICIGSLSCGWWWWFHMWHTVKYMAYMCNLGAYFCLEHYVIMIWSSIIELVTN